MIYLNLLPPKTKLRCHKISFQTTSHHIVTSDCFCSLNLILLILTRHTDKRKYIFIVIYWKLNSVLSSGWCWKGTRAAKETKLASAKDIQSATFRSHIQLSRSLFSYSLFLRMRQTPNLQICKVCEKQVNCRKLGRKFHLFWSCRYVVWNEINTSHHIVASDCLCKILQTCSEPSSCGLYWQRYGPCSVLFVWFCFSTCRWLNSKSTRAIAGLGLAAWLRSDVLVGCDEVLAVVFLNPAAADLLIFWLRACCRLVELVKHFCNVEKSCLRLTSVIGVFSSGLFMSISLLAVYVALMHVFIFISFYLPVPNLIFSSLLFLLG